MANNDAPAAKPRPQAQQTNNVAPQESVPQNQDAGRPSDQDLQWAANLEKRVNEQGYQPTQAEVDKYTDIATRLNASQGTQAASNASAPSVQGGVTKAELDWADALQTKSAQGYTPTAQEMATYTDIYNRSQSATQQPSASTAQNTGSVNIDLSHGDPDLQWALSLLDKVQQGYQPNQSEITKYEQVIAKNQAVPATP
ncbi:hypothetical protein EON78_04750 [bacterium]|nr:MAG: hypothetical protein EON78_04750 [bacterium]